MGKVRFSTILIEKWQYIQFVKYSKLLEILIIVPDLIAQMIHLGSCSEQNQFSSRFYQFR